MRDDKARTAASCSPSRPTCFDVGRSTSDNVNALVTAAASFAWRNSPVPGMEVGWRDPAVVVGGGDLAPGQSSMEDVDGTRTWEIPVGDVVVESDARGRTGGGPIEPSTVRTGFMVVGVGILLPVVLEGVVTIEFIRTLFPKAVTRVAVAGGSEVFPTLGASLPALERWGDKARCVGWGENTRFPSNKADLAWRRCRSYCSLVAHPTFHL